MTSLSKKATPGQQVSAFIAVLVILGVTAGVWYWMQKQPVENGRKPSDVTLSEPTPLPTPTPKPRPIPHGKWGFGIMNSGAGPKFSRGYLDPYDPAQGTAQTITIYVADDKPVTMVQATVKTDNKVYPPIPFTRVNGSDMGGEWQGIWTVNDTYFYTYVILFEAESANGKTKVESTFR